jgi:DNA-binding LacI/PurR family transcriptional regulator
MRAGQFWMRSKLLPLSDRGAMIAQDSATIGRTAIEMLLARVADPTRPGQTVTVPVELIVRGSGELPPA